MECPICQKFYPAALIEEHVNLCIDNKDDVQDFHQYERFQYDDYEPDPQQYFQDPNVFLQDFTTKPNQQRQQYQQQQPRYQEYQGFPEHQYQQYQQEPFVFQAFSQNPNQGERIYFATSTHQPPQFQSSQQRFQPQAFPQQPFGFQGFPQNQNAREPPPNNMNNNKKKEDYYEVLGITKEATTQDVTKAYYKLAKKYHPDKNPDDPNAEDKFKVISEAYQVLSDPEKRKRHDQLGFEGMSSDFIDPMHLFKMLFQDIFGGGKFQNIFGEISLGSLMNMNMNDPASRVVFEGQQQLRVQTLSGHLIEKLETYVSGKAKDEFKAKIKAEALELVDSPGGPELLQLVSYVYESESKQHNSFFLGQILSEVKEKGHMIKSTVDMIQQAVKVQEMQNRMQQSGIPDQELEEAMMSEGLKTMWKMGKLEIETTLRRVCEIVLGDPNVAKKTKKKRAAGVLLIADIYHKQAKAIREQDRISPFANFAAMHGHPQPQPQKTQAHAVVDDPN